MPVELSTLQNQISTLGLLWRAGITTNSRHSFTLAQQRTGAVPPAGKPDLKAREQLSTQAETTALQTLKGAPIINPVHLLPPASLDWRNKSGQNYVTPIKDQGGCGSCVAFGTVAALESWIRIANSNANMQVDKSEAHLWFCYGPNMGAGACPAGGWWPDQSYTALQQGITDAACFPYTASPQPCRLLPAWQETLTHTTGWHSLSSQQDMKSYLAFNGPLTACFTVYEDFYYYYTGGIYTYNPQTSGNVVGGHCICIVGYDDTQRCWIAKNSWGGGWGESGFFQISYGSCGIDSEMWAINALILPILPVPGSRITGYQTSFNSQQHVISIGTDNHIHELVYTNQWTSNDLTVLAGAPPVGPTRALDGYETAFNNQQHVNYIGADNHVHELVYTDHWIHNDLTALANAPAAAAESPLDGYATTFNNQQHVNYIGAENHVHELVYKSSWIHNDLTALAKAPAPKPGSPLDGYQSTFDSQQHVNYIGGDNHVHELVYKNSWSHTDLTASANAPAAGPQSSLDGYATEFNNQQHVNYVGADNHVYELVYTDHWIHNDLTSLTNAPAAATGSPLDGYQTTFNNQQHVNYICTQNHVNELVYIDRWIHNDLTALAGAVETAQPTTLDGYATTFNNQQHVNYIGADNHVHELVYIDNWSDNDLTEIYNS